MRRLTDQGLYTQIDWHVIPSDPNPNLFPIFDSAIKKALSLRALDYDVRVPDTSDWIAFAGTNREPSVGQVKRQIHVQKITKILGQFVLPHNDVMSDLIRFDHPEPQNEVQIVFCGTLSSLLHLINITYFLAPRFANLIKYDHMANGVFGMHVCFGPNVMMGLMKLPMTSFPCVPKTPTHTSCTPPQFGPLSPEPCSQPSASTSTHAVLSQSSLGDSPSRRTTGAMLLAQIDAICLAGGHAVSKA